MLRQSGRVFRELGISTSTSVIKGIYRMLTWLLSLFVLIEACFAQGIPPTPRQLVPADSRSIQVPPFSWFGESQCDGDGNMYFHGATSDFRAGRIFLLSRDGNSGKLFQLAGKFADAGAVGFDSFFVTSDGGVFILSSSPDEKDIFPFDHDGAMKKPISLEVPTDVQVTDFAVFDNEFLFVWGYHNERSSKELQGKRYEAILTDSGQVSRELAVPMPKIDIGNLGGLTDGAVASSSGRLYFLGPNQITVISQTGEVARTLQFRKPDPKAVSAKLYISGGMVVIAFNTISTDGQVSRSFLALEEDSGDVLGYYKPSSELGESDVCFNRSQGLTFLQGNGHGHAPSLTTGLLR
jgi:hypothetical protein